MLGKHVRRMRRQHLSHRPAYSGVYTEIDAVPSSFRHVSHDLGDRAREWDSGSMVQLEISRKLGRFWLTFGKTKTHTHSSLPSLFKCLT